MVSPSDRRILFLIKSLVALMFLSKISLAVLPMMPSNFSLLVFQSGMHPFVNVFFCVLFGLPLLLMFSKVRSRFSLSPFYKVFILVLFFLLAVQTVLQAQFVNPRESFVMQIAAMLMSLFMISIYGVVIPSLWPAQDFVRFVQRWSGVLVLLSLILGLGLGGYAFKGGRFIGVFKHIPHMVTCATVAFIFSLGTFLYQERRMAKIWSLVVLLGSFACIVLTGTRSSAVAGIFAFILTMIFHKTKTNSGRIFKFSFLTLLVTYTLFFGAQSFDYMENIATGKNALGARQAQDGVASRWEEFERGSEMFLEHPWLGQGLLSKFASGNEVDVANYNAMKDPHNIFISAGVIGGWPLLALSVLSILLMTIGSFKTLVRGDIAKRQIAIYLLAHIPILVIYHVHLSIGGMADRLYWLVFGFVAATSFRIGRSRQTLDSPE